MIVAWHGAKSELTRRLLPCSSFGDTRELMCSAAACAVSPDPFHALACFLLVARHIWWRDFTDLATSFKHRTVQIYGEDPGSGEDQLVCKFVTPLQAHHVIDGMFVPDSVCTPCFTGVGN